MSNELCKYYNQCGGCSLQHVPLQKYIKFKRNILVKTIERLGAEETIVEPLVQIGKRSRRRVEFKTSVNKGKVSVGFYAKNTHDVIDVEDCLVTQSNITKFIDEFRNLITVFKKPSNIKAINITKIEGGVDIYLIVKSPIKEIDKEILKNYCTEHPDILRCAEKIEKKEVKIIYNISNIGVKIADVFVELPVQSFLQATQKGQEEITNLILKYTTSCNKIADLYAGCGTYTLPLAQRGNKISAYEGNYDMVISMTNAIRNNNIENNASAITRNLVKRPLSVNELTKFEVIIINPPREGAISQIKKIAKSGVQKVIMVSCNPKTFERDTKHLIENNYRIISATPIDQFYQTKHLEIVAVFIK